MIDRPQAGEKGSDNVDFTDERHISYIMVSTHAFSR